MKVDLLYEIGTEEIPAGYLPPAIRQLEEAMRAALVEARLDVDSIETHATPRRITLVGRGLPERQEDRSEEVTGPPWKAAFAEDGTPTKAAEGFARGRGLAVADLKQVETERGPYVGATVQIEGRPTADLLAEILPQITARLSFPKTMRWGPAGFRFARPIRWLLALLGETVIPFEIEGVLTGSVTHGHRILAPGPFEVKSLADYEPALEKGKVMLRAEDRAARIETLLHEAAAAENGRLVEDPALVREVAYLVETPSVFAGSFDDEFLELPSLVIITAMRDHQRYFAVEGEDGELRPRFLCVSNSAPDCVDQVMDGNQRVLRARLDDARFYWTEDLRTTLEEKRESLAGVVWLEGFGSLKDKAERIAALGEHLAAADSGDVRETVARAALLSKSDLVTEMIKDGKEFTALQGVIGREYALRNGEPADVALALEEQYRPRFAGDDLPRSAAGAYLAIADRLDTLAGVWGAGLKPTGSKDPFALRRGALGVVRILLDREIDRPVEELLAQAAEGYGDRLADREAVVKETSEFVRDRLSGHLVDEEGLETDVVAAVVPATGAHPIDALARARALAELRDAKREDLEALAAGYKRARNILKKDSADGSPEAGALTEDAERKLYEAFAAVDENVAAAQKERRYGDAFADLATLRGPIDDFFDHVLVLAEDDEVRRNRLRLLGRIVDRIRGLADLSRLTLPEDS